MSVQRVQRIQQVLNTRQPDLTVFMDDVHKPQNLGAIVRTCDATGVPQIHAWSTLLRLSVPHLTSGGSRPWVKFKRHPTAADGVKHLKDKNFKLVAAHLSPTAMPYTDYDFTQATALVVGTEKHGVSQEVLEQCDEHIIVPMTGMVESLNVSVAAALILFEARRQRELAGMYKQRRIDDASYEKLFFEWCQPKLARYCQKHGLDYLPLDEEGDPIGTFPAH